MQVVGRHDSGNATRRFSSIRALRLRDELAVGNTQGLQVFAPDHAFAKEWIVPGTTGNDNDGSQPAMIKLGCMIEPGFVNRRRPPVILSGAKNYNGVRRARFILFRLV